MTSEAFRSKGLVCELIHTSSVLTSLRHALNLRKDRPSRDGNGFSQRLLSNPTTTEETAQLNSTERANLSKGGDAKPRAFPRVGVQRRLGYRSAEEPAVRIGSDDLRVSSPFSFSLVGLPLRSEERRVGK